MSFEGFYLTYCKNKHLSSEDANIYDYTCPICNKKVIKSKLIDITNGIDSSQLKKIINKFKKKCKHL